MEQKYFARLRCEILGCRRVSRPSNFSVNLTTEPAAIV
jgi:hypothetical protein